MSVVHLLKNCYDTFCKLKMIECIEFINKHEGYIFCCFVPVEESIQRTCSAGSNLEKRKRNIGIKIENSFPVHVSLYNKIILNTGSMKERLKFA